MKLRGSFPLFSRAKSAPATQDHLLSIAGDFVRERWHEASAASIGDLNHLMTGNRWHDERHPPVVLIEREGIGLRHKTNGDDRIDGLNRHRKVFQRDENLNRLDIVRANGAAERRRGVEEMKHVSLLRILATQRGAAGPR